MKFSWNVLEVNVHWPSCWWTGHHRLGPRPSMKNF